VKRRILAACLLILLILAFFSLALAVRVNEDERGVWTGRGPGIEVIYLSDQAGPALWLYLRGRLVWPIEAIREALPERVPDPPTVIPTPHRLGPMELEQAWRADRLEVEQWRLFE
jgi:hypothetical protein